VVKKSRRRCTGCGRLFLQRHIESMCDRCFRKSIDFFVERAGITKTGGVDESEKPNVSYI
jgi:hypothetical protein